LREWKLDPCALPTAPVIVANKACSGFEVVASSFGLLALLLRQHLDKSALQKDGKLVRLKNFLIDLDLSCSLSVRKGLGQERGKSS
jgi:hypothetical protein